MTSAWSPSDQASPVMVLLEALSVSGHEKLPTGGHQIRFEIRQLDTRCNPAGRVHDEFSRMSLRLGQCRR